MSRSIPVFAFVFAAYSVSQQKLHKVADEAAFQPKPSRLRLVELSWLGRPLSGSNIPAEMLLKSRLSAASLKLVETSRL